VSTRALIIAALVALVAVAVFSHLTGIQPCSGPQRAAGACPPRRTTSSVPR
jgi:hypothetical protein